MNASTEETIIYECCFCRIRGVLKKKIFKKSKWHFCEPCLLEVETELEKRMNAGIFLNNR